MYRVLGVALVAVGLVLAPCPDAVQPCPCYNFEDGLFLECPAVGLSVVRTVLSAVHSPIQSFSIYDLAREVEVLSEDFFPDGTTIRHLQISHTGLRLVEEGCLTRIGSRLESLSLVSSRLTEIPRKALSGLETLRTLDLESNSVSELPSYSFYGLRLTKINVKANCIDRVSEHAFVGLEFSLTELDISENKLSVLPMSALARLDKLRTLKLAWNRISSVPDSGRIRNLLFLDLSSNEFSSLPEDAFQSVPSIKSLSLYYNSIETIDPATFSSLSVVESIDLSHNKIVVLESETFKSN